MIKYIAGCGKSAFFADETNEVNLLIDICILDDKYENTQKLKQYSDIFCEEHPELPVRVQTFTECAELLKHTDIYGGFDIYIFDVIMPDIMGLDLAKKIRARGERAEIIFITISREYAVEAFGVKAAGYLVKPIQYDVFSETVMSCIKNLQESEKRQVLLKTVDGIRRVYLNELVLVESFNHICAVLLVDGTELKVSATLSALFEMLKEHEQFYMPHRSYIINMDFVIGIRKNNLLMTGNIEIPIARAKLTELKYAFTEYYKGGH